MPSKKSKKKTTPKKTKASSKKRSKAPPKKKESTTPNYNKWTKEQLIDELNAVMDILKSKGKVYEVEKLVEVPGPSGPAPAIPSGPFEIDVIIGGAPVTLRNPNDVVGFLTSQGLVESAILR